MSILKRCLAESIGTFWLVFGGCGSAIFACTVDHGIGFLGVSLAFGLTVLTMAFAIGHISGCHLNPAVSLGLWASKRFNGKDLVPYIVAQLIGAILAALALCTIAGGADGGFAANAVGEGYTFMGAFVAEFILTFIFLFVILGATDDRAPAGFAPIAIGLCLTLIHLISIPITNTSVNPARSTSQALFVGGAPLMQLWMFWVAPIGGAILAGIVYPIVAKDK